MFLQLVCLPVHSYVKARILTLMHLPVFRSKNVSFDTFVSAFRIVAVRHEQITQFSISLNLKVPMDQVRVANMEQLREQVCEDMCGHAMHACELERYFNFRIPMDVQVFETRCLSNMCVHDDSSDIRKSTCACMFCVRV